MTTSEEILEIFRDFYRSSEISEKIDKSTFDNEEEQDHENETSRYNENKIEKQSDENKNNNSEECPDNFSNSSCESLHTLITQSEKILQ